MRPVLLSGAGLTLGRVFGVSDVRVRLAGATRRVAEGSRRRRAPAKRPCASASRGCAKRTSGRAAKSTSYTPSSRSPTATSARRTPATLRRLCLRLQPPDPCPRLDQVLVDVVGRTAAGAQPGDLGIPEPGHDQRQIIPLDVRQ